MDIPVTDAARLVTALREGVLAFPATHFEADGALDLDAYAAHVDWLAGFGSPAVFAAAGAGEFFSLTLEEFEDTIRAAVEAVAGRAPVFAGCGYGTRLAERFALAAERAGADGLLLMPPYLVQASQEGLRRHVAAVCGATRLGVVLYSRDNGVMTPELVRDLVEACPTIVGYKDGVGDFEALTRIAQAVGDRVALTGGMPTAETFAVPYFGVGVRSYSSAILNFLPDFALAFRAAVAAGDGAKIAWMLNEFVLPYVALRNRGRGYAVSIIKAGLRIVGRPAGPVRSPLTDLTAEEEAMLGGLIDRVRSGLALAS